MEVSSVQSLSGSPACQAALSIDILDGEGALKAWRDFADVAQFTPYQSPNWLSGVVSAFNWPKENCRLLFVHDAGTPHAALPLHLTTRFGCTLAEIPGSQIGNSDWFPQRLGVTLDRQLLDRAFATLAHTLSVDVLRFSNLPPAWQGLDNPLLNYNAVAAPDHLYLGSIGPETRDSLPKRRRVDILRGQRRLEELVGPISLRRARSEAEIAVIHAAFLEQRAIRFREMGVANIFAEPSFRQLFDELGKASLHAERPTMCFDALYAGDEILATAIGVQTRTHYSQYINSNVSGPASKYSLMGLLMYLLIDTLVAEGVESIDMGVGDFGYKETWTQKTPVYDLVLPLTAKGKLFAPAFGAKRTAKRLIKQHEHLWSAAKTLRQFRQSLRKP